MLSNTRIQIYHVHAHENTAYPPALIRRDHASIYKILDRPIPPLCSGTDHIVVIAAVARVVEQFCPLSASFRAVQILNPRTDAVEGDAIEVRPHQEVSSDDVFRDPLPTVHLWRLGGCELFVAA